MPRPTRVRIDLGALRHNLGVVRRHAPDSRVMAVVKANAYGHGMERVAATLAAAGVDALGVTCLAEARRLREAGIAGRVVLLEGSFHPADVAEAAGLGLDLVVHQADQIGHLEAQQRTQPVDLWLKVDTGMNRLGFELREVVTIYRRLRGLPRIGQVRLMSHLSCADDRRRKETLTQTERFGLVTDGLDAERSLANSGGVLGWPGTHMDWVRPGLMLYGASPFVGGAGADLDLRPVMHFETELIAVRGCSRGDPIGYGGAWVCPHDTTIGIAAVGYGDGYPRHLPSGSPVRVGGHAATLIGRVSMDMITVDLSNHPRAEVGAPVTLWGDDLPVEEVARAADTIPYELLCAVSSRVPVEFVEPQD